MCQNYFLHAHLTTHHIVLNKIECIVHELNFSSHYQPIQIIKQSDEVIKLRDQIIDCINVKPKSENGLGFLK